jgi:hypothetical protein
MKEKEESEKRERKKEVVEWPLLCNPPNLNSDFGGCESTKTKNLACGRGAVLKSM